MAVSMPTFYMHTEKSTVEQFQLWSHTLFIYYYHSPSNSILQLEVSENKKKLYLDSRQQEFYFKRPKIHNWNQMQTKKFKLNATTFAEFASENFVNLLISFAAYTKQLSIICVSLTPAVLCVVENVRIL